VAPSAQGDQDPRRPRRQAGGPAHGCPEKAVEENAGQADGPGGLIRFVVAVAHELERRNGRTIDSCGVSLAGPANSRHDSPADRTSRPAPPVARPFPCERAALCNRPKEVLRAGSRSMLYGRAALRPARTRGAHSATRSGTSGPPKYQSVESERSSSGDGLGSIRSTANQTPPKDHLGGKRKAVFGRVCRVEPVGHRSRYPNRCSLVPRVSAALWSFSSRSWAGARPRRLET